MVPSDAIAVDVAAVSAAPSPPVVDEDPSVETAQRVLLQSQLQGRVGTVIRGKWRLDALLGVGGMAAVYAATHRNGHRCAVKMLLPTFRNEPEAVRRFLTEGYLANEVGHPGTVPVTDDDVSEDGEHFLVMELLEGESLERFLRRFPAGAPPVEVARIGIEVLDVLAAAHAHGVVHRDIKPDNVFVCKDGGVRLLDFGIARMRQAQQQSGGTRAGAIMGTPAFMPPEQARGRWEEVDARSDLWAVGATLFVALSGRALRSAPTANEELLQAMTEPPPPVRSVCPDVPPALADVVDRALSFDRAARWTHAREMQAALRSSLGEEAPTVHAPPPIPGEPAPDGSTGATAARAPTDLLLSATRSAGADPKAQPKSVLLLAAALLAAIVGIATVGWAVARARHASSIASSVGTAPGSQHPADTASSSPPPPPASAAAVSTADTSSGPGETVASASAASAGPVQGGRSAPPAPRPATARTAKPVASAVAPASVSPSPAPSPDPLNRRR